MTIACGPGFAYGYWVIGKRMRAMADVTDVATLPDIARVRFQSQAVRGILAVGLCLAAIAYLSSQVKGGAKLMNQMLGVSEEWGVAIMFGSTLAYMLVSGMSGSILTDAFQGLVMLIGVIGVMVAFFSVTGGDFSVIMNNPYFGPKFVDGAGAMPFQLVITFAIVFFIGVMGQPTMLAKMYSVKTHKDLKTRRDPRRDDLWVDLTGLDPRRLRGRLYRGNGPGPGDQGPGQGGFPLCEQNGRCPAGPDHGGAARGHRFDGELLHLACLGRTHPRPCGGLRPRDTPMINQIVYRPLPSDRRDGPLHRVRVLGGPSRGHSRDPRLGLLRLRDDTHLHHGAPLAALLHVRQLSSRWPLQL